MVLISLLIVIVVVCGTTKIELAEYFYLGPMLVFFVAVAWLVGSLRDKQRPPID